MMGTQLYNSHYRYSRELFLVLKLLVSSWLVCGGGGAVGLGLGVLGLTLIGHIGNIASVSVYSVGDLLEPAVGKGDVVAAGGGVTVPVLVGAVVVAAVVVLDAVGVGVLGGLVRVGGLLVSRGGGVGRGGVSHGGGDEHCQGEDDLEQDVKVSSKLLSHNTVFFLLDISVPCLLSALRLNIMNVLSCDHNKKESLCQSFEKNVCQRIVSFLWYHYSEKFVGQF